MVHTTIILVVMFILGFIIGGMIVFAIITSKFLKESDPIGDLRIDESDPDGPYLFLELDTDVDLFKHKETVTLKVKAENFIPQK